MELNSIYHAETVATVTAYIKWSVYNILKKASVFTVISEFKQHRNNFHVSLIGIIFNWGLRMSQVKFSLRAKSTRGLLIMTMVNALNTQLCSN